MGALRRTLDARFGHRVRMVVLATVGGLATGLLGWAMPLVLTDGSEQVGWASRPGTGLLARGGGCCRVTAARWAQQ